MSFQFKEDFIIRLEGYLNNPNPPNNSRAAEYASYMLMGNGDRERGKRIIYQLAIALAKETK